MDIDQLIGLNSTCALCHSAAAMHWQVQNILDEWGTGAPTPNMGSQLIILVSFPKKLTA